jgi:hypothetical protein
MDEMGAGHHALLAATILASRRPGCQRLNSFDNIPQIMPQFCTGIAHQKSSFVSIL